MYASDLGGNEVEFIQKTIDIAKIIGAKVNAVHIAGELEPHIFPSKQVILQINKALGGNAIHTVGKLPAVGTPVKDFTLTGVDLKEKTLADFKGKYIIMNIFPSVNTGVCSKSVRKFNEDAAKLSNTVVLCISKDLPFAHPRHYSIKTSPEFAGLKAELTEQVRAEVIAAQGLSA